MDNPEGVPTFYNDRVVDREPFADRTKASDTLTGATSSDVHAGLGHPGQGQTSSELHHDGEHHRKKHGLGQDQWGTTNPIEMKVGDDDRQREYDMKGFSREQPDV